MSHKTLRTVLICVICLLVAVLFALATLVVLRMNQKPSGTVTIPTSTTEHTLEATQSATQATTEATDATTVATTVETEPQPIRYVLTFAGDCTLANQKGASLQGGFIGTIGKNYDLPFSKVIEYFANDTATFINMEGTLTDSNNAEDKMFVFKGPKDYINILTQGSVEFANIANNHIYDYGQQGYNDTLSLLDEYGIAYAESKKTVLFEVDGLKIGVYAVAGAYNTNGLASNIKALKKAGAEVIIACMHWGEEYYYVPNMDQVTIARAAIDAGADIVYGHHPHVLQKIEQYKDGIIFYSLGNFSFGGNNSPADKDTAILQQEFIRYPDGTLEMGELTIIPCYVTGIINEWGNDYQPMPIPLEDEEAYQRVLTKLAGKYHLTNLHVSYRDDLNTTAPSDGTDPTGDTGSAEETQPAGGETQPSNQETQPAVDETQPAVQETQPVVDDTPPSAGDGGSEEE